MSTPENGASSTVLVWAKAALEAYVRQLAVELAPRGITANAVLAGVTRTAALDKIPGSDQLVEKATARNPHKRLTTPEDVAACLVELARPGTGLVTSVIAGTGERTLGAALENLQLATVVAPAVVLSNVTRRPFTIGKSMAIWRRDLAKIGGFSAFSDVLAEDHVLGDAVLALGLAIRTSLAPIENRNVACSTRRTLERHARWAKIRKSLSLGFWGEPLGAPHAIGCQRRIIDRAHHLLGVAHEHDGGRRRRAVRHESRGEQREEEQPHHPEGREERAAVSGDGRWLHGRAMIVEPRDELADSSRRAARTCGT